MSILFGSDVDIQLANTSFSCNTTSSMSVALFTATDKGTYHFTGTLTATTQNSSFGFGFLINGTYKDLRTTDYTTGPLDVNLDFTADVGDVITLSASGIGTGSNLAVTEDVKKPREIYVGEGNQVNDYSAMRGPCPEGFHVPTINELHTIVSLLSSSFGISYSGDNLGQYLLMPFTGYRDGYRGSTTQQNTRGWYWSATCDSIGYARAIYFTAGSGGVDSGYSDCTGMTIRPFKDIPVIPDSSWATLYDGSSVAAGAGIFHISTPGLISVSGNGTDWITIADKNLGATIAYISGDTLSESNCGGYFQRGNNYMFPYSGTITTSNTQVDASEYGPGNYYSSNTFIGPSRRSDTDFSWNTPANPNLRGGETGVQQKQAGNVTEVYVGTTKVRPSAETYIIDLTESYSNTIPAGDTINKVKILLDVIAAPSALISIGSGNNGLSLVGNGIGLPGGVWVTISTSDLSGTIEYDFNTSIVSFDLTSGGHQQSGSQQFSYWTIDESIDEPISYTISQWGDPSSGTVKISIERE